jgi:heptosyltransferase-2
VAQSLAAAGMRVVIVGGPDEASLAAQVAAAAGPASLNLAGRTSLSTLGAVLQRCHTYAGNDSGVTHIAAAVGTPVVAVFGPTNAAAWGPWTGGGAAAVVFQAQLPCSPCVYRGHSLGTPEGCPRRTCLELVTPEQVVAAVLAQVEQRQSAKIGG